MKQAPIPLRAWQQATR